MQYLNVDKLQKVNKLAKELKAHGLVGDMQDAYTEASAMANATNSMSFLPEVAKKMEMPQQHPAAQAPSLTIETNQGHIPDAHAPESARVAELEKKIASIEVVMMKMQHAMNDIFSEIRMLKEEAKAPAHAKFSQAAPAAPQESHIEAPARGAVEIKNTKAASEPHPRQGNFKSEDVAIDKFFYFGNKRQ